MIELHDGARPHGAPATMIVEATGLLGRPAAERGGDGQRPPGGSPRGR